MADPRDDWTEEPPTPEEDAWWADECAIREIEDEQAATQTGGSGVQ